MDYRGITHPRHAGLSSMLPVNSGQPQYQLVTKLITLNFSKNTAKIRNSSHLKAALFSKFMLQTN